MVNVENAQEIGPPVNPHRKEFFDDRVSRVVAAASAITELTSPLVRWSSSDVTMEIAEQTGLNRCLVLEALDEISQRGVPLNEDGVSIRLGRDNGQPYVTAVLPNEPIRRLPQRINKD